MKLTFLGVSSALSVGYKNFHSNMLVESADTDQKLLIDCGGDVRHSLYELGFSAADIDAVYISHLHADHVGGLEWLAFSKFFVEQNKLPLYISTDQKQALWDHVLSGGMSTLEESNSTLETFFKLRSTESNKFIWSGRDFELIKVPHSYSNHELLPSYGLFVSGSKLNIFITTDTRFAPDVLNEAYERADIIFHDCETSSHFSKQHAHYTQLVTLPFHIKQKMWLYDYNDVSLPDAVSDGFKGFVTRGQVFDF
ncbi:MAG: MBL fold metallo-hydrolase [Neisseriaceae bacterium]|nr:MAG: MBL fold metallo-hydrolase [Neisseriaceae bacterium]